MTIPEIILQKCIQDGFKAIRRDSKIINIIFKNLPVDRQEAIKTFITESPIDLAINYPRQEPKIPAIILLLKTEVESNSFLGDIMGAPPHYDMPDHENVIDTLGGGAANVSPPEGLPAKLLGPLNVLETISTNNAIIFTEESQDEINAYFAGQPESPALKLYVVAGTGKGQIKDIASITSEQLDIRGTFDVELDNTSLVDIRYADNSEAAYGQPLSLYENNTGLLRIGANYEEQYQVDVLASNQDEVIYLYAVLKAILFFQRKFLEAQGIMALRITGTDLIVRNELLPSEIFARSMTLQFTYPFDFLVEQEVAKALQITFTSVSPTSDESFPNDVIILDTLQLESP